MNDKKTKNRFNKIALVFAVVLLLILTIMQGLKFIDG